MPVHPHLHNIDLLIDALRKSDKTDRRSLSILSELYRINSHSFSTQHSRQSNDDWRDYLVTVNYKLSDLLKPALIDDPSILHFDKNKLEQHYTIFGHDIKFKIDTGAVTNVIDAEAKWDRSKEEQDIIVNAYKEYVKIYPDDGAMTKDVLKEISPEYHNLDFGKVESFDLMVYRSKKDKYRGKDAEDEIVNIEGPFDVVGISSPAKNNVEGETPYPVIAVDFVHPVSNAAINTTVSLKPRNITTRGLLSRTFVNNANLAIMPESRNIQVIDLDKVDLVEVEKALHPALTV